MGPISLSFDVTDALPADATEGQRITIAAWLFFPKDLRLLGPKPVTMALLNGGSYDKRYFHIQIPGHPGYSAAEHLAGLGNIVLLPDHLGVGESSSLPDPQKATRQIVALANHAAVNQFYDHLWKGNLHPQLPAIREFAKLGGGHSMGGMQTITQQAEYRTYDAAMILGYTAVGVHFTIHGKQIAAGDYLAQNPPNTRERGFNHETFHWDDVPPEVIAADDAMSVPTPPVIGMNSITAGIVSGDVGRIESPLYICLGQRDVSPDAHAEPSYYKRCSDLTLQILPRSGHCQNFASTRHQMWNRMHTWARSLTL